MWWWLLLLIPVGFLAVILIRALRFKPKAQPAISDTEETFDEARAIESLQRLIRFKTVSYADHSLENDEEFDGMIAALPSLYPNVFATCEFQQEQKRSNHHQGGEGGQNVQA